MRMGPILSLSILLILVTGIITISVPCIPLASGRHLSSESKQEIIIGTMDRIETSLDMALEWSHLGWNIIACLSSGLVEVAPGSNAGNESVVPALAESWIVLAGGSIWDFTLRQGIVFESGIPFNASSVKYTFDRNCNLTGDGLLEPEGPQFNIQYNTVIDNVTILSEYVVRFYLKIPFAPFLQLLSISPSYMVDPMYAPMNSVVEFSQGNPRESHPCGLGPYILESWTRVGGNDEEMRLVANPNYWGADLGKPKVENITIKFYSSSTALAAAKNEKEVDIAFGQLTPNQIQDFMNQDNVNVFDSLSPQIQYLCFNQQTYPYNETEVRQAVGAALDRTYLCDVVFIDQASPLLSIIPPNLEYHLASFRVYGDSNYTFTRAKLQLFGYNATNKLSLHLYYENSGHYPHSAEQAAVYKMQLEETGVISVTLHGLGWGPYRLAREEGTMDVFIYGWYDDYPDADNYALLPFADWLNLGYNKNHPQGGIDQYNLWLEGRTATNDIGRRTAYYELQELQAQECSIIPLWQGKQLVVADTAISGIHLDISGALRYWLLERSEVTPPPTMTPTTPTTTTTPTAPTTPTTTNTTNGGPADIMVLVISLSSVGVIVIVVIAIINSRKGHRDIF
jgi:peptide/nickel transport system substrate-binding protein